MAKTTLTIEKESAKNDSENDANNVLTELKSAKAEEKHIKDLQDHLNTQGGHYNSPLPYKTDEPTDSQETRDQRRIREAKEAQLKAFKEMTDPSIIASRNHLH